MIIESSVCLSVSNNNNHHQQIQFNMAMSKPSIKQNGHLSTNENRTDDDYGGGGNSEISS
jgi:hypothetical protein